MVTEVIGDHETWAFSLVGAIFRIRFRSVVRGPRDTTFVIFAFVAGFPKSLLAV